MPQPQPAPAAPPQLNVLPHPYPAWTYGLKAPMWLLPSRPEGTKVAILPLTVDPRPGVEQPVQEKEDREGRVSRGTALHLLDVLTFQTDASPIAVFPMVIGQGLVLFGSPYDRDQAFGLAGFSGPELVGCGEVHRAGSGAVALTIWDRAGSEPITVERSGLPAAVVGAVDALVDRLAERGTLRRVPPPAWSWTPDPPLVDRWLTGLSQLLALGQVRSKYQPREALYGERNILEGLRDLARMSGEAQPPKLAFLSGLALFRYIGIDMYLEFRDEMLALVDDEPDRQGPFAMAAPYVYHLYDMPDRLGAESSRLEAGAGSAYRTWLERLAGPFEIDLKEWPRPGT